MFPTKTEMGIFLDACGNVIELRKVAILLNFPKELTDIQSEKKTINAGTGEFNLSVTTICHNERFIPSNIYHFKVNDLGDRLWL